MEEQKVESNSEEQSATYQVFILALTIFSLVVMVLLVLPILSDATRTTLQFIDTLICVIFLLDFTGNMRRARVKRQYFLHEGGWLDLLGSIPSLPAFPWTAILRLARLGRLARILSFLRTGNKDEMWAEFKANRAESALYMPNCSSCARKMPKSKLLCRNYLTC